MGRKGGGLHHISAEIDLQEPLSNVLLRRRGICPGLKMALSCGSVSEGSIGTYGVVVLGSEGVELGHWLAKYNRSYATLRTSGDFAVHRMAVMKT